MVDYFAEQTDDDGNVTYILVESVEVTDEQMFADPRYKKVQDSDIKRRKKIRALNAQVKELEVDDPPEDETEDDTEETEKPTPPTMTSQEIIDAAIAAIDKRDVDARTVATARTTELAAIMEKHKLKKEALPLLEQSNDPEAAAELLGRSAYGFEDTDGGDPGDQGSDLDGTISNVYKSLGLAQDTS